MQFDHNIVSRVITTLVIYVFSKSTINIYKNIMDAVINTNFVICLTNYLGECSNFHGPNLTKVFFSWGPI